MMPTDRPPHDTTAPPVIDDPATRRSLEALCEAYERAIAANDADTLTDSFWTSEATVRFGFGESLWGYADIADFIRGRSGAPRQWSLTRSIVSTFGTTFGTYAAEYAGAERAGRVRILQSWVRLADGWRIVAAHVSHIDSQD